MSWFFEAAHQCETALVQKTYRWPDRPSSQRFMVKGDTLIDAVYTVTELSLVHIEKYAEDALLFERLSVLLPLGVGTVSELPHPVEPKAEVVVAERVTDTKFLLQSDPYLKLVLCPGVGHDFPVMLSIHKRPIA